MSRRIRNSARRASAAAAFVLLRRSSLRPAPARGEEEKKGLLGAVEGHGRAELRRDGRQLGRHRPSASASTLKRSWAKDSLTIKAFALSSRSTTITRTAQGTETDYTVLEEKTDEPRGRELRPLRPVRPPPVEEGRPPVRPRLGPQPIRRRSPAGSSITAGTGYAWVETKRTTLKTDAGLTYTWRKYFGQSASSFAGFRAIASFEQKILETSSFASQFIFDENLKRTVDWRYDWTNSLTASISKALALKTSLRLLYAHLPADQAVPLYDLEGTPHRADRARPAEAARHHLHDFDRHQLLDKKGSGLLSCSFSARK